MRKRNRHGGLRLFVLLAFVLVFNVGGQDARMELAAAFGCEECEQETAIVLAPATVRVQAGEPQTVGAFTTSLDPADWSISPEKIRASLFDATAMMQEDRIDEAAVDIETHIELTGESVVTEAGLQPDPVFFTVSAHVVRGARFVKHTAPLQLVPMIPNITSPGPLFHRLLGESEIPLRVTGILSPEECIWTKGFPSDVSFTSEFPAVGEETTVKVDVGCRPSTGQFRITLRCGEALFTHRFIFQADCF